MRRLRPLLVLAALLAVFQLPQSLAADVGERVPYVLSDAEQRLMVASGSGRK